MFSSCRDLKWWLDGRGIPSMKQPSTMVRSNQRFLLLHGQPNLPQREYPTKSTWTLTLCTLFETNSFVEQSCVSETQFNSWQKSKTSNQIQRLKGVPFRMTPTPKHHVGGLGIDDCDLSNQTSLEEVVNKLYLFGILRVNICGKNKVTLIVGTCH